MTIEDARVEDGDPYAGAVVTGARAHGVCTRGLLEEARALHGRAVGRDAHYVGTRGNLQHLVAGQHRRDALRRLVHVIHRATHRDDGGAQIDNGHHILDGVKGLFPFRLPAVEDLEQFGIFQGHGQLIGDGSHQFRFLLAEAAPTVTKYDDKSDIVPLDPERDGRRAGPGWRL